MSLPEKPLTRRELYLAKAAGQDVTLPETDLTREEMYLREIANGGGGGDVTKEYVDNAIADAVADIDDDISALSDTVADKVDKVNGKGLSTNDYTDADKALVQDSPITVTATGSDLTLSTSSGNINALTVYGKSEIINGEIVSAGEGWSTVDLGTLNWGYNTSSASNPFFYASDINIKLATSQAINGNLVCTAYNTYSFNIVLYDATINKAIGVNSIDNAYKLVVTNTDYTDPVAFKTAMSGVILCYELADPTQGNVIAVKTDNGTSIDGTMATFTTGTPLRGIPDTTVRDVMEWDGTSGEVTKNCNVVDLETLNWEYKNAGYWLSADISAEVELPATMYDLGKIISQKYINKLAYQIDTNENSIGINVSGSLLCNNGSQTNPPTGALVYKVATPTTQALTSTENASLASLRTFTPQTHIQNNAGADMKIEAYAGTANGQAIADLKSELKITQSDTLTLTVAGWSNNAQTVTYAHDTTKRNVIDVDPASVEEWASCGVLATAETTSGITFSCKTVPENALTFRVTSMGVN